MPRPLTVEAGGPYTAEDITSALSQDSLINFYYWLGNIYDKSISKEEYKSAIHLTDTDSYRLYLENIESKQDKIATLLWDSTFNSFMDALEMYSISLDEVEYKYNKQQNIVVSVRSLKDLFGKHDGSDVIFKVIDRINSEKDGGRKLRVNSKEGYYTI
jgi:hypothetical protein